MKWEKTKGEDMLTMLVPSIIAISMSLSSAEASMSWHNHIGVLVLGTHVAIEEKLGQCLKEEKTDRKTSGVLPHFYTIFIGSVSDLTRACYKYELSLLLSLAFPINVVFRAQNC